MIKLSDYTLSLLDDIERRIDPDTEEDFRDQWTRFWYTEMDTDLFTPRSQREEHPQEESAGRRVLQIDSLGRAHPLNRHD